MGVYEWAIWKHEVAVFDWTYDTDETCYFLTGEVVVTPENGEAVSLKKGDLVIFSAGLKCRWDIRQAVKKHYHMGS
jgi:uncharacterized cupin superfamily protein